MTGNTNLPLSSVTVNALPASITNSTNFTATVPLPNGTNIVSVVAQPSSSGNTVLQHVKIVTTGGSTPYALLYDANGNTLQDEKGYAYKWSPSHE